MDNAQIIENCIQACADWGLIPTSFRQCMTWEEQVLWLAKFLQETVIPTVNQNAEAFNDMKEYVEHYFDNLDVQEQINAKLEEMAQSGELTELIEAYLQPYVEAQDARIATIEEKVDDVEDKVNTATSGCHVITS